MTPRHIIDDTYDVDKALNEIMDSIGRGEYQPLRKDDCHYSHPRDPVRKNIFFIANKMATIRNRCMIPTRQEAMEP